MDEWMGDECGVMRWMSWVRNGMGMRPSGFGEEDERKACQGCSLWEA